MPITINIEADSAEQAREQMLALLGGDRYTVEWKHVDADVKPLPASVAHASTSDIPLSSAEPEAPKRTRRTKAQIEADEAAAKNPIVKSAEEALQIAKGEIEPSRSITVAPEDRVNPQDEPAEEEADGIEDMADIPNGNVPLSVDDLRTVAGLIVRKFDNDVAKAQAACVGVFKANGVESISKCPDDKIAVVHAALSAIANG